MCNCDSLMDGQTIRGDYRKRGTRARVFFQTLGHLEQQSRKKRRQNIKRRKECTLNKVWVKLVFDRRCFRQNKDYCGGSVCFTTAIPGDSTNGGSPVGVANANNYTDTEVFPSICSYLFTLSGTKFMYQGVSSLPVMVRDSRMICDYAYGLTLE